MAHILCVDDEAASLLVVEDVLQQAGHTTVGVRNAEAALTVLARGGIDLVVSDYRMPGSSGLDLLAEIDRRSLDVPLVMLTAFASIEHAVSAIKAGAVDYVTKPVRAAQLELTVEQALELVRLKRENARLRDEVTQIRSQRETVGESAALQRILETVRMVAPTRATVLIQGESGTGKELLARTLHGLSDRSAQPFVAINCAAIPESLVESTLFGHEKGAFTGAVKAVKGAFERAHRGTLLLDEISEMRLDLQAKLLRVLQEHEFERVGGSTPIAVDVRVVATTNRDLRDHVRSGAFREDLYYRLNVVPIVAPPLRERKEDIPLLVQHFVQRASREMGRAIRAIEADVYALLSAHDWPGNVRELSHAVERAVILSRSDVLGADAFSLGADPIRTSRPAPGSASTAPAEVGGGDPAVALDDLNLSHAEEVLIQRALERTGNNRTRAADLLGISVRTLRNKLNGPGDPRPTRDDGAQLFAPFDDPEDLTASS